MLAYTKNLAAYTKLSSENQQVKLQCMQCMQKTKNKNSKRRTLFMSSFRLSDDVKVILSYWLVWHKAPDATTVRIYAHNIWHWYHRNAQLPNSQTMATRH